MKNGQFFYNYLSFHFIYFLQKNMKDDFYISFFQYYKYFSCDLVEFSLNKFKKKNKKNDKREGQQFAMRK